MAYQNVGTPRFYVNVYEWAKSNGIDVGDHHSVPASVSDSNMLHTLPVSPTNFDYTGELLNLQDYVTSPSTGKFPCFVAILGHDFDIDFNTVNAGEWLEIINKRPVSGYKGFSIVATETLATEVYLAIGGYSTGSVVIGVIYDMPHSPELKLTMSREMDGVKKIRTKGGADLVDHKYTGSPLWGNAASWELYSGTPNSGYHNISRRGRRVWSLSFNYLQDSDIFPDVSSLSNYEASGYSTGDSVTDNTLLNEDTFFSQVVHKTNGYLPFIFQPDNNNNNPDGFAICRFDQSSFEFNQVANGVYNVKLKIREAW